MEAASGKKEKDESNDGRRGAALSKFTPTAVAAGKETFTFIVVSLVINWCFSYSLRLSQR